MAEHTHESVLKQETINQLQVKPDGIYVDCTLGRAGHAQEIAKQLNKNGLLIGFDQDLEAIHKAEKVLPKNSLLIHANFRDLKNELVQHHVTRVDGILFDLGVSSPQLDDAQRGFSYQKNAPLDMRMDHRQELKAFDVVNNWTYEQLVRIFFTYGEEKFSKQIARHIERERQTKPIKSTFDLVEIIKQAIPAAKRRKGGHPAKRIFQAIRIAVNDELQSFTDALHQAAEIISINGRIAVLTFHSLEDRICKQSFKTWSSEKPIPKGVPLIPDEYAAPFKQITRKPIIPKEKEIANNRRARSAKLRVVEKIRPWDDTFTFKKG